MRAVRLTVEGARARLKSGRLKDSASTAQVPYTAKRRVSCRNKKKPVLSSNYTNFAAKPPCARRAIGIFSSLIRSPWQTSLARCSVITSGHLRMVITYWDMAAGLVNNGAISPELFNDTNGEHIGVFAKLEPLLGEIRAAYGPQFAVNFEKLIDATPDGRKRTTEARERIKAIRAQLSTRQAAAA